MKRNLLRALQANTAPTSDEEFNQFLLKRFGTTSRENASSDLSMLDKNDKKFLKFKTEPASKPCKRA